MGANATVALFKIIKHMQQIEAADHSKKNTVWKIEDDKDLLKYFNVSKNTELIAHFKRPYKSLKNRYAHLLKELKYDVEEKDGEIVLKIKYKK
jgi:hypothetical protein